MNTNGTRRGAATPPRQTYDRAATARRIRAITVSTALAGAGAVVAFGLVAADSGAGSAQAIAAVSTTAAGTTPATTTAASPAATTSTTTTTTPSAITSTVQSAPAAVSAGTGAGQVVSGGS